MAILPILDGEILPDPDEAHKARVIRIVNEMIARCRAHIENARMETIHGETVFEVPLQYDFVDEAFEAAHMVGVELSLRGWKVHMATPKRIRFGRSDPYLVYVPGVGQVDLRKLKPVMPGG